MQERRNKIQDPILQNSQNMFYNFYNEKLVVLEHL